ncbi:DUF397 domain-containing protein [Streptomyces bambusae]|uniref:DUF397 domain-containing protein n=1 Tax=Streptomyces bambusae TaxID=1550616 RepID=UPI001CFD019F|nr:DUF397 domain-containing protein [Streptomyces bambusae]MCB5165602.1 DUF397 domain-containing protein [Streptomyces bambusae]
MTDSPDSLRWFKSSYSNNGGNCVEVASLGTSLGVVLVRDSKVPDGPRLAFTRDGFAGLVALAKG